MRINRAIALVTIPAAVLLTAGSALAAPAVKAPSGNERACTVGGNCLYYSPTEQSLEAKTKGPFVYFHSLKGDELQRKGTDNCATLDYGESVEGGQIDIDQINLEKCANKRSQRWSYRADGEIVNKWTGLDIKKWECLTFSTPLPKLSSLDIEKCKDSKGQRWSWHKP